MPEKSIKNQIEWFASLNPIEEKIGNQFLRKTYVGSYVGSYVQLYHCDHRS